MQNPPDFAMGNPLARSRTPSPRGHRGLQPATVLHLGVHALLVVAVATLVVWSPSPSLAMMIGGTLSFVVYLWIGLREGRRSPLWVNPLSFYFVWYCVGLGLSAVYLGTLLRQRNELAFSNVRVPAEDIAAAYTIFLL